MLYEELQERLKAIEPDITTIKAYWQNAGLEQQYTDLDTQSNQENFWQNPNQATILKELQKIRLQRDQYLFITRTKQEITELLELFKESESELQPLKKRR